MNCTQCDISSYIKESVPYGDERRPPSRWMSIRSYRAIRVQRCIADIKARSEDTVKPLRFVKAVTSEESLRNAAGTTTVRYEAPHPSDGKEISKDMLEGLGDLSNLQQLELNVENIGDASKLSSLGVGPSLVSLSMNVNKPFPNLKCFSCFSKLGKLSLNDNYISSLEGIESLISLEELNIESNNVHSLDPLGKCDQYYLRSLRRLNVSTNQIRFLPACFGPVAPFLQNLSFYQNRIANVPPFFLFGLDSLSSIDLGRNQIKDSRAIGKALSYAPTLRTVILLQNRLKALPSALNLPLLDELWLSSNDISSSVEWAKDNDVWLPSLTTLRLEDNCISILHPFSLVNATPNIQHFDVSFNELDSFEKFCTVIKGLEHLQW